MHRNWRHHTVATAGVLAVAASFLAPTAGGAAAAEEDRPIVGSEQRSSHPQSATVTLISGDRVRVTRTADDQPVAQLLPDEDGITDDFETLRDGDALYVFPEDAAAALATGRVDRELFNVTGLIAHGFDDAHADSVRVIAQYDVGARSVADPAPAPQGAAEAASLTSINAVAYAVAKDGAESAWAELTTPDSGAGTGLTKLWLDEPLRTTLADSTSQIGAPVAWEAGLDGNGSTVAVLDTGIDAEHPDLQDRILDSKDFTGSSTGAGDVVGHGTHVASTVAGTGAASDGKERGVAPGAKLLIGKVLDDSGSGYESEIIAGMQWAVENDADVVSMSLGANSPATTCDDPIAQSVGELSSSSNALFIIAAGNMGSGQNTVSSPGCAPAALTVGAVDGEDATAQFSSRGPVGVSHLPKPEIAAPGVGILAAATGGRGVYAYRAMSGTSMATPHVAGAAAIALQAHPELTGQQLKQLLTSSADPDIEGSAHAVGTGRLDIERMLAQTVTGQSSVYGGEFAYPQTKEQQATSLTYTNAGDTAIDLRLSVEDLTGNDERPVKAPLIKLPQHVTVPAHGSVEVPVTVNLGSNLPAGALGDITARIIATGDGQQVSTAFNLYAAPPTVNVNVTVLDRNGNPAAGGSSVDLVNTDTSKGERRPVNGAEQTFTVRPGRYFLTSFALTPTVGAVAPSAPQSVAYLAHPQLDISKDTKIVLDAREAHALTVSTEQPSELRTTTLSFERQWKDSWVHAGAMNVGAGTQEVYAQVTGEVRKGDGAFEFGHWSRRMAPIVESMTTSEGLELHPRSPRPGIGNLDGEGSAEAVAVGAGTAADFAGIDVQGKVAVAHIAGGSDASIQTLAADAGAKALLVFRDAPGTWLPANNGAPAKLPVYSLTPEEGAALAAQLAAGAVTLTWSANGITPYVYTLGFFSDGKLVTAQKHEVSDESLGRIEADYSSMGVKADFGDATVAARPSTTAFAIGGLDVVAVPSERTEYLTADGTEWFKSAYSSLPYGEAMNDRYRSFAPGEVVEDTWYSGAVVPGVRNQWDGEPGMIGERQGELIGVAPAIWSDSAGHWADQGFFGDVGNLVLKRDGVEIGKRIDPYGVFEVPSESAVYELTLNSQKLGSIPTRPWKRSTSIQTSWTFTSQEEPDVYSRALPMLIPHLDIPADGMKTVAAGSVEIPARVQANPGYTAGDIVSARVWTSTDGGVSWVEGTANPTSGGADLLVDHGDASGASVSIRVELTDSFGASVRQTITRAYDVR